MSVVSTMSPKLRAALGAGVLLMCWLAGTCTRQTPGAPSGNQSQPNQSAENTPPKPATAPTAAEEKPSQSAAKDEPSVDGKNRSSQAQSAKAVPDDAVPTPLPSLVIPAGSVLTVRTNSDISAKSNQPGTGFQAVVAQEVTSHGRVAIPAGSAVAGVIVQAKQGGKIKGSSELALQLTSLHLRSDTYTIHTNQFVQQQKGKGKRTAKIGVGGAAGGALIGGIAGGGKGAAIGSLVGGGAGVAGSAMTGNKELEIPAESLLSFKLTRPLRISGTSPSDKETNP